MKAQVSDHAAQRFRERFGENKMTLAQARRHIADTLEHASRLYTQRNDRAVYEGPPPARMQIVVRHPGTKDAAVLTVLFAAADGGDEEMGELYGPLPDPPAPKPVWSRYETAREKELSHLLLTALNVGLAECEKLRDKQNAFKAAVTTAVRAERKRLSQILIDSIDSRDDPVYERKLRRIAADVVKPAAMQHVEEPDE